ncbi:phBC6A51 family helix-turn-helix protein [Enterococcus sp. AZ196]|uniref:phBC6A51 family helix-turn-helix protein n=1 Tax=Enterococcus sp. AZ196 TaxID=2774659 RepID=UPI003D26911D
MSEDLTNANRYKPTPAEKKLLEILINPEYIGKSVTDICKAATISRFKYYEAMKNEEFTKLVNEITMDLIKGKASDVLNASYKYALTEKGHQDRKMILTIAGIYTDKQDIKHSGGVDIRKQYEEMSDEELEELVKRYEKINDS